MVRSIKGGRGFTIVELLIVVVVIAILAAIVIISYNGIVRRGSVAVIDSHLSQLIKKVEVFNVENGDLPPSITSLYDTKDTDGYYRAANTYCVSALASDGKVYSRVRNESVHKEGECANIRPSYPVAPEDCFDFNPSLNAITGYYSNRGNNANLDNCPADFTVPGAIGGVSVTSVQQGGFSGNGVIRNVVLPDGMTSIIHGGFTGSTLEYVYFPPSLQSIGSGIFSGTKVSTMYIPSTLDVGDFGLTGANSIKSLYLYSDGTDSSPGRQLGGSALTGVEYLNVGKSVTSINPGTFYGSPIKRLHIQGGSRSLVIGSGTFYQTSLKSIDFPARVVSIGTAFVSASSLERVTFQKGLSSIGPSAFTGSMVTSVSIPSSTVVDATAFPPGVIINRF